MYHTYYLELPSQYHNYHLNYSNDTGLHICLYSLLLFLIYTPQDLNLGLIEEAINFYSTHQ